ncbi:MAG: hypothetical protein EP330_15885 [Deltaproteobacteria bacterium]|nr:MAG: hypothetical protein EP330_15885 [Deltaproteobacteria bacterium]
MLLLLTLATALAGTTCTSVGAGPEVIYRSYSKSGGAHPAADTVMFDERWTVDGVEIFRHVRPYIAEASRSPDVDWEWQANKTTDGRVKRDDNTTYEVHYRTEARLFRPSGAELVPGLSEWQGKMACERVELRGVP